MKSIKTNINIKKSFSTLLLFTLLASTAFAAGRKDKFFDTVENGSAKEVKSLLRNNKDYANVTRNADKETLLQAAIKEDRELEVINYLLKYGADPVKKDAKNRTPIMYAAQYSTHPEVLERLIKVNAPFSFMRKHRISKIDKDNKTAFDYAEKNTSKDELIAILEKYGKRPETKNNDQSDSITDEEVENNEEEPQQETNSENESQQDLTAPDVAEVIPETPAVYQPTSYELAKAAADSSVMTFQEIQKKQQELEQKKLKEKAQEKQPEADIPPETVENEESVPEINEEPENATETIAVIPVSTDVIQKTEENLLPGINPYKKTYLFDYATMDGTEDEVPPESNYDPDHTYIENANKRDIYGRTKLMNAARNGDLKLVENLIYSDADVNAKDNDGWTALMFAARFSNNPKVVRTLLRNGAEQDAKNNYGVSSLKLAAGFSRAPAIVAELLTNHSAAETDVRSSFIYAVSSGAPVEILEHFYQAGLPVNASYDGKTPLMYAAESNKTTKIIAWLLDKGAKTTYRTSSGLTAFDFAKMNKNLPHDKNYWVLSGAGEF